jgi:pyruvate dehydrogenase E2 component (dihydrolipoamide acetyltransferase)
MTIITLTVPDLGGVDEVEVIELSASAGQTIAVDDALAVVESDKASMDLPATEAGVLVRYLIKEGDRIAAGAPLAEIEVVGASEGEAPAAEPVAAAPAALAEPVESSPAAAVVQSREIEVAIPDIGSDGLVEVIEISAAVGDELAEGDTLLVLESDKATMDVPVPQAGTLLALRVSEGDKVASGAAMAVLRIAAAEQPSAAQAEPQSAPQAAPQAAQAVASAAAATPPPVAAVLPADDDGADVYAGPAVRKLARELGVALAKVAGSGPRGRILKDDVSAYVKQSLAAPAAPAGAAAGSGLPALPEIDYSQFGAIETRPASNIAKATARNMVRSWLNVPHVTHFDKADITELESFRATLRSAAEARNTRISAVAFAVKAVAVALREQPIFRTALSADGEQLIEKQYCHIGIAVDTERGLMVPVLRDADQKGIWQIAAEVAELAALARSGKLKPAQMQGGCFTISSLGAIGGTGFTPIVNAPEVGILGLSKTTVEPVWDGSEFQPRQLLPMALSYDHRTVNGGDAGRFMVRIVELLGDVRWLAM